MRTLFLSTLVCMATFLAPVARADDAAPAPAPVAAVAPVTAPTVTTPIGTYAGFALMGVGLGVAATGGLFAAGDGLAAGSVAPLFGAAGGLFVIGLTLVLVSDPPRVVGAGGDAPLLVPFLAPVSGGAVAGLSGLF